jgi:hypothetical protein
VSRISAQSAPCEVFRTEKDTKPDRRWSSAGQQRRTSPGMLLRVAGGAQGTRPSSCPSHTRPFSPRSPLMPSTVPVEQGSGARQQLHQRRPWFSPHGRHVAERQPFSAAWPPSAPSSVCSVRTHVTPCSSNQCLFSETMLVRARTALLERERGMSFSRFQAWLKPCLGSLEQGTSTGLQCLWTLWRARIQRPNRTQNRTPNAEPDMRRT